MLLLCANACSPARQNDAPQRIDSPNREEIASKSSAAAPAPHVARDLPTADDWDNAEKAIVRLLPSAFSGLPRQVIEDSERRGCTIPQSFYSKEPHNVIKGAFTAPDQLDWAILCSRNGVSSMLVYRRGATDEVVQLAEAEDRHFLQGSGGRSIVFSRLITAATAEFIHAMNKAYDAGPLPPIDHEGINDAFVDKGSSIKYWYQGKWLDLQGAD